MENLPQHLRKLPCVLAFLLCFINHARGIENVIDFRRQIQPILSEHCSLCHGADANTQQGGLRLDSESAARQGGDSGQPAIKPGDSAASLMIQRILSNDADAMMPPPHAK